MRVVLVFCLSVLLFGIHAQDNEELEEDEEVKSNEDRGEEGGYLGGFSYHNFRGPVSGAVHEVRIPEHEQSQHRRVDYVARPDYNYAYGVDDPKTGNLQTHQESRDGNSVKGEYRVVQPDGKIRIVKYTAGGPHGFQATVHYEDAA